MPTMKGSGEEVGELLTVKCTYPDCLKHFDTQKEMKRHKLDDTAHNYCKKCDVDCEDNEALVQHKVDEMSPWLEGKMTAHARDVATGEDDQTKIPAPKHIVCEFCGADFKSFGGRKRHRAQEHVADQSITCPGCGAYFHRAANLVHHLEDARCSVITRHQFLGSIRQKHFLNAVFRAPDEYLAALQMNKSLPQEMEDGLHLNTLTIGDSSIRDDSSGVETLLDQDDPAQKDGHKPMKPSIPEADLIDFNENHADQWNHSFVSYNRAEHEKWPRLPGMTSKSTSNRSTLESSVSSSVYYDSDGDDSAITSRHGGVKIETASDVSLHSRIASSNVRPTTSDVWKVGKQNVQSMPRAKAGDWSNFSRHKEEEAAQDHKKGNILYSHWWDPRSEDYNVERFLAYVEIPKLDSKTGMMMIDPKTQKPVIGTIVWKYCCPDPDCRARFDSQNDFETHWVYGHGRLQWRCSCCLKLFKTVASLTRHCESTSKCDVKRSDQLQQLVSDMTGGLLKTKRLEEPRIFRQEKALVIAGKPIYGLMPVEYST